MARRTFLRAVFATWLFAGQSAYAQQPPPPPIEPLPTAPTPGTAPQMSVEDLLREGVRARQEGRDEEALEHFRRAYNQSRSPRALGQIALAEQALGRWIDADAHLREALRANDPWITANQGPLQNALTAISEHIGLLMVTSNVEGAELVVGGRVVGRLPLREPVRTLVGPSVTVLVRAPRHLPTTHSIAIQAGSIARHVMDLTPDPNAPPDSNGNRTPPPDGNNRRPPDGARRNVEEPPARRLVFSPLFWIGAGVAGTTAITAGALGGVGLGIQGSFDSECASAAQPEFSCIARREREQGQLNGIATAVNALWIVSAAGLATGAVGLILTDYRGVPVERREDDRDRERDRDRDRDEAQLRLRRPLRREGMRVVATLNGVVGAW